jgi:hypothetical protein
MSRKRRSMVNKSGRNALTLPKTDWDLPGQCRFQQERAERQMEGQRILPLDIFQRSLFAPTRIRSVSRRQVSVFRHGPICC